MRLPVVAIRIRQGAIIPATVTKRLAKEKMNKPRTKTVIPANTGASEKTIEREPRISASEKRVMGTPRSFPGNSGLLVLIGVIFTSFRI